MSPFRAFRPTNWHAARYDDYADASRQARAGRHPLPPPDNARHANPTPAARAPPAAIVLNRTGGRVDIDGVGRTGRADDGGGEEKWTGGHFGPRRRRGSALTMRPPGTGEPP